MMIIYNFKILFLLVIIIIIQYHKSICQTPSKDSLNQGELYQKKGGKFFYENFDSCIYYYQQALQFFEEKKDTVRYIDCTNALYVAFFYKKKYAIGAKYLLKAYDILKSLKAAPDSIQAFTYHNIGYYYNLKGHYKKAGHYYRKAMEIDERSGSNTKSFAVSLANYGEIKNKLGDLEEGLLIFKQAASILEASTKKKERYLIAAVYMSIAGCYEDLQQYKKSRDFLLKSLNLYLQMSPGNLKQQNLLGLYYQVAVNYLKTSELNIAKKYIDAAFILQKKEKAYKKDRSLQILGRILQKQKKYQQARTALQEAVVQVFARLGKERKIRIKSEHFLYLAELEFEMDSLQSAFNNFQNALIYLTYGFDEKNIYKNPTDVNNIISTFEGLRALKGKAQSFYQYYHQTQNLKDLEASLDAYEVAHQLIQKTRQDIISRGSKHQLAGQVLAVYEGAIKSAIKLYEVTEDRKYLEKAFFYAENNKAISLLESINENVAKHYGGIPDSLLEKETDWRIDITFYEKQINQEKQKAEKGDPEKIKGWEEVLFELKQQYNDLVKTLEEKYPKYHELKYQMALTTVADIQKNMLDEQSVFLEYFVGDEKIYLFRITKQDFQVFDFERKAHFEQTVQKLLDAVHYPNKTIEGFAAFKTPAFEVYQHYLSAALQDLPASISRLLIVPDDALGYIPFEVLLREQPGENTQIYSIDALSYLFEDFLINYAYSGTLLERSLQRESKGGLKPFLGFAPSFGQPIAEANRNCSSDELYSLNCSTGEVQAIQTLMGGEVLTGKVADKASFMNLANQYQVIHLATHSCADEQDPRFSKIFFADDYVSNQDLFNLPLQADLAVLSSCNTGSGKLVKGEGVMSLSKGFIHSGCPSTLISLWSVDDCATSDIMVAYYTYLKQGLTKDQALQSAKIEYLQSVDKAQQHPYYWAAFVQMGNFLPLDLGSSWGVPWWAGFVLGLFALLGVWIFRRNGAG